MTNHTDIVKGSTDSSYNEKLNQQKNQNQATISAANLDYDPSSVWEVPALTDIKKGLPFFVQETGKTIAYNQYYVRRKGWHSYMLSYVTDGTMQLSYRGQTYILEKNNVFLIDCTDEHILCLPDGINKLEVYFVHFWGDGANQYMNYFQSINESPCLHLPSENRMLPLMIQLLECYTLHKSSIMTDLHTSTLLSVLCYEIVNEARMQAKARIPDVIGEIRDYIEENYMEDISLKSLSERFFLSESYLQRQFKKYVGESPHAFLTEKRITEAKRDLRSTSLSIQEIAFRIGFHDVSYFIHVFQSLEGMTPLHYRKFSSVEVS